MKYMRYVNLNGNDVVISVQVLPRHIFKLMESIGKYISCIFFILHGTNASSYGSFDIFFIMLTLCIKLSEFKC